MEREQREKALQAEREKKEREERMKKAKSAAAKSGVPYVVGVLKELRDIVYIHSSLYTPYDNMYDLTAWWYNIHMIYMI